MSTSTLAVVSAGLGRPSSATLLAGRLAVATGDALAGRGAGVRRVDVEIRDHAHDLTENLLTGSASDALQRVKDAVAGADGLIAVTPIHSASYTGLFKMFFDVLERGALRGMPVLIAATAGTARHSLALDHTVRPLFAHLGALVSPTAVCAPAGAWTSPGAVDGQLSDRIRRAGAELADLVGSCSRNAERSQQPASIPDLARAS